jgi:hypothetical protein
MSADVGATVIHVLEEAGKRYLRDVTPEFYHQFMLQIGGTDTVRRYDGTICYWQQVQAILDCFFDGAERAEIAGVLIDRAELRGRPEFRGFLIHGVAERRMQAMLRDGILAGLRAAPGRGIPIARSD